MWLCTTIANEYIIDGIQYNQYFSFFEFILEHVRQKLQELLIFFFLLYSMLKYDWMISFISEVRDI